MKTLICHCRRAGWILLLPSLLSAADVVTVRPLWDGSEAGPWPCLFELERTGDLSLPLSVGFDLGGTAEPAELQVLDPLAQFAAGAATCQVAILPLNDTEVEAAETVTLSLRAGAGYVAGTPSVADASVEDASLSGWPGLLGEDGNDLGYFELETQAATLRLRFLLWDVTSIGTTFEIFLDTDGDPRTGMWQPCSISGYDHVISGWASQLDIIGYKEATYFLYRLGTGFGQANTTLISGASAELTLLPPQNGLVPGLVEIEIPLAMLGNPASVEGFVKTAKGGRLPRLGSLNGSTRTCGVRDPRATRSFTAADALGDAVGGGLDLSAVTFHILGDQFFLAMDYASTWDPDDFLAVAPKGQIWIDSDHSLATGGYCMGRQIPTWGGDVYFHFELGMTDLFTIYTDPGGAAEPWGGTHNDLWWKETGQSVLVGGSLDVLDALVPDTLRGASASGIGKFRSDGAMIARVRSDSGILSTGGDYFPDYPAAFDLAEEQAVAAAEWPAAGAVVASDPLEFGGGAASANTDLIEVKAQVVGDCLVVQGTLSGLYASLEGVGWNVFVDVDCNAETGIPVRDSMPPLAAAIGAEYQFSIAAVGAPVFYTGTLLRASDQRLTVHEAMRWISPRELNPSPFIVAIPLATPGNPSGAVEVMVASHQFAGGWTYLDFAPHEPLRVPIPVSGGTAFERWLAERFADTPADAVPGADPDRDGQMNSLEFFLGSDPRDAASVARPELRFPEDLPGWAVFTWPAAGTDTSGVRGEVQCSQTLGEGSWTAAGVTDLGPQDGWLRYGIKLAEGGNAAFLRLAVTVEAD